MVNYKVVKKDGSNWYYDYWRNNSKEKGALTYNIKTGEHAVIKWAADDEAHTFGMHVWAGVYFSLKNGTELKDEGYFMWY